MINIMTLTYTRNDKRMGEIKLEGVLIECCKVGKVFVYFLVDKIDYFVC